jgi:hypothetical protein
MGSQEASCFAAAGAHEWKEVVSVCLYCLVQQLGREIEVPM